MSEIALPGSESPFDALRHVGAGGRESWSARELQRVMSYARWENFEVPLNRAMKAAENVGADVVSNFLRSQKIVNSRAVGDYELTRYAAYLVAMNGDPNKAEVAQAQTYFAVKTREAEAATASPTSELDILRRAIDQIEEAQRRAARAEAAAVEAVQEATVANARIDAIEGRHDYYAALGWAKLRKFAPSDERTLASLGRIASTVGKQSGMLPGSAPHAHFGSVNTWPLEVWDEAARRLRGAA